MKRSLLSLGPAVICHHPWIASASMATVHRLITMCSNNSWWHHISILFITLTLIIRVITTKIIAYEYHSWALTNRHCDSQVAHGDISLENALLSPDGEVQQEHWDFAWSSSYMVCELPVAIATSELEDSALVYCQGRLQSGS